MVVKLVQKTNYTWHDSYRYRRNGTVSVRYWYEYVIHCTNTYMWLAG